MTTNSRQKSTLQALAAKQEGAGGEATATTATAAALKGSSSSTLSRQWSSAGFRNPRIVRVSRTFGGKDRHSKVCTVRGLRDRRIRLSVPTAVQLYDLQDRLGLSQPSKVIDWLIEATKSDIDKLPPLQIPQGFGQFHQQLLFPNLDQQNSINSSPSFASFFDGNNNQENYQTVLLKEKEKVSEKANEDQIFAQKFFPISNNNQSSLSTPGMMNNNGMGYNFYHSLETSNLSLSQFGSHGFAPQIETNHANNPLSFSSSSSSSSFPSGSHQLFFCPPPSTTPSVFAPFPPLESSTTTTQHFLQNSLFPSPQLFHSSSSNSKQPLPFPSFFNHPKFFSRGNNDESRPGKDHTAGS
ncbi:hypothetical protein UlMin_008421 [Ulmus minor]